MANSLLVPFTSIVVTYSTVRGAAHAGRLSRPHLMGVGRINLMMFLVFLGVIAHVPPPYER